LGTFETDFCQTRAPAIAALARKYSAHNSVERTEIIVRGGRVSLGPRERSSRLQAKEMGKIGEGDRTEAQRSARAPAPA
jgi:hypothetical protein